jgi:hypothetical protein
MVGLRENIQYAIVALNLAATEVARIIHAATGVSVDPKAGDVLHDLDRRQLELVWERLSADSRWKKGRDDERSVR